MRLSQVISAVWDLSRAQVNLHVLGLLSLQTMKHGLWVNRSFLPALKIYMMIQYMEIVS